MNQPHQQRCRIANQCIASGRLHLATNTAARGFQESLEFDAEAPLQW